MCQIEVVPNQEKKSTFIVVLIIIIIIIVVHYYYVGKRYYYSLNRCSCFPLSGRQEANGKKRKKNWRLDFGRAD